jgi:hypothetical protein
MSKSFALLLYMQSIHTYYCSIDDHIVRPTPEVSNWGLPCLSNQKFVHSIVFILSERKQQISDVQVHDAHYYNIKIPQHIFQSAVCRICRSGNWCPPS